MNSSSITDGRELGTAGAAVTKVCCVEDLPSFKKFLSFRYEKSASWLI